MTPTYPEDCPQAYYDCWWYENKGGITPGRLVYAYLPHTPQVPMALVPKGRGENARQHELADCEIVPMHSAKMHERGILPVAGLPLYGKGLLSVYRAKRRPAIVLSLPGPELPASIMRDKPGWMKAPLLAVAPCYGVDEGTGKRAGFPQELVSRVRHCEYPHLVWDILPLPGAKESIIRLDHLMPLSADYTAYELTPWTLCDEAMIIMKEWIAWHILGDEPSPGKPASLFSEIREVIIEEI